MLTLAKCEFLVGQELRSSRFYPPSEPTGRVEESSGRGQAGSHTHTS